MQTINKRLLQIYVVQITLVKIVFDILTACNSKSLINDNRLRIVLLLDQLCSGPSAAGKLLKLV